MSWDEEIPGTDGGTSADPLMPRRRRLSDLLFRTGEQPEADDLLMRTGEQPQHVPLSHRIADDPIQGRSGGPGAIQGSIDRGQVTGGSGTGYQDPGKQRLADLMARRSAMDAPQKGPGFKKGLLQMVEQFAPMIGAAASGQMGATVGAEKGIEEGIQRRHQVQDVASQRREADKVRLQQEIDAEARAGEQRTFQHGEDEMRQRTAEHGMDERARMAQQAETGRNERLVQSINSRESMQQDKFGHDEEMEDQKQQGRMALQRAKAEAQATIAKWKQAHPSQTLPPVLTKAFGTYQQSQSRMDVMDSSYKDAMRDPGNQQAQLNLLANHLGMTMGLQPGARMNVAIINEAKQSGYLDERIEAHFGPDGYMTGVVLTPRQMGQMMTLAQSRLMEDARAVRETEAYVGKAGYAPITPRVPEQNAPGGAGNGADGAGATNAAKPATNDTPKPPRAPDPGKKWQYNPKTKQFREVATIATK
jgi:hypothetical protein